MSSERKLIQQIQSHVTRLVQAVADAKFWHDQFLEQARQEYQHRLTEIEIGYEQAMTAARAAYETTLNKVIEENNAIIQTAGFLAASWDDPLWASWSPLTGRGLGGAIRIGQLIEEGQWHRLTLPALLPVIGGRNVVIKASGAAKETAVRALQSLMLRLLATIPPGKLRFLLIDPQFGQNVAGFVRDLPEELTGGKAWFEAQHIEQQLAALSEHMGMVIQKYLGNQYLTLEDYNAAAGEVAEPYRILVVIDFPANFTPEAAHRLVNIAASGPRCGVYSLVSVDTAQPPPYGFNLADLERTATVIAWDGKRFTWQDPDFKDCLLELDAPPPSDLFDRILAAVSVAAKEAMRVEVPFERIAPTPPLWWQGKTHNGLMIPLGRAGATKIQHLELGRGTAQHVLVAGKTGSGKSNLLHTIIVASSLTYPPDELGLYLVDFKKGVEFKTYATHQLPHARVIAIESEREFGLSVLQGLDAELKRRGDLFRAAGVDHIADYRQKTGQKLPRLLLLVDEFQEFFTEDDTIASQASQILDRLVRQGRAFGIHVLLGSQTLAGAYTLASSTIGQMAVRIALQCSEADSRLILADDNPAARLLSRPGEAIYNAANGLVEGNILFQVAWLPDEERDHYLEKIQEMAQKNGYVPLQPQIVFEGNVPADITKNRPLHDLLAAPYSREERELKVPRHVLAWLGEPVAIRDPIAAIFRRQSGSNLLIVGRDEELAMGLMIATLVSLAAQLPSPDIGRETKDGGFYILDFSAVDAPYADLLNNLASILPHFTHYGRSRQVPDIIAKLAAELERRSNLDEHDLAREPDIFLFIYGLQRARALRQEEGSFSFGWETTEAPPSPAYQFSRLIKEGPELGIHIIAWCDTYANLTRTVGRYGLRGFAMRVAMQMSAEDSANLLDTPAASKLGLYRAYFYSEDEGRLEKFRPYGLPTEEWLAWVKKQLAARLVDSAVHTNSSHLRGDLKRAETN
jgi:energy-coupling factor transporter ATP-binding protein EcfA2